MHIKTSPYQENKAKTECLYCLEDKTIVANIDRPNKHTFQQLVISLIFSRSDIGKFPFQICNRRAIKSFSQLIVGDEIIMEIEEIDQNNHNSCN